MVPGVALTAQSTHTNNAGLTQIIPGTVVCGSGLQE